MNWRSTVKFKIFFCCRRPQTVRSPSCQSSWPQSGGDETKLHFGCKEKASANSGACWLIFIYQCFLNKKKKEKKLRCLFTRVCVLLQGTEFNSQKAIKETLHKSERTKILMNTRASDGNKQSCFLVFNSIIIVLQCRIHRPCCYLLYHDVSAAAAKSSTSCVICDHLKKKKQPIRTFQWCLNAFRGPHGPLYGLKSFFYNRSI